MSTIIESTIKSWPGTITFKDTIGYPEKIILDESIREADEWLGEEVEPGKFLVKDINRYRLARLPGILQFVESHTLQGLPKVLTVNNFPSVPLLDASRLFILMRDTVGNIVMGHAEKKE